MPRLGGRITAKFTNPPDNHCGIRYIKPLGSFLVAFVRFLIMPNHHKFKIVRIVLYNFHFDLCLDLKICKPILGQDNFHGYTTILGNGKLVEMATDLKYCFRYCRKRFWSKTKCGPHKQASLFACLCGPNRDLLVSK